MDAPAPSPAGKTPNYGIIENADGVTDAVLTAMAARPTRGCARSWPPSCATSTLSRARFG